MYRKYIKRKERVIIDAVELLDEQGIQGLTTKELARREGITEPAIYRQFDGKKDIILAILDKFSTFDEFITNTILEQKMKFHDALLYYLESYATYYQSYPQISTVLFSFDVFKYEPETNSKMQEIMDRRYEFIALLARKGVESGELDSNIEPGKLAEIALGILWSATWRWKMTGSVFNLKENIMSSIRRVIDSI